MYHNFTFSGVSYALPALLRDLLRAPETPSRAGKTKEMTHVGITLLEPLNRELLVPARRAHLVAQIAETAWVLAGRNDVEWLSHYLPRARDFSDDGKTWRSGYGPRLRNFHGVDQLADVVSLLREDPETRRAAAVLWDPQTDREGGKDVACNNWLHFLSRSGQLDLHVAVRSNDIMWGWSGINAFEWSVLLEIVAGLTGLTPGALHFSTSSLHLYERHWEHAARIVEESDRTEFPLVSPSPQFDSGGAKTISKFDDLLKHWFAVEYDIRTASPFVQGYIDSFPEPMLKSWLIVLDWWWNGRLYRGIQDLEGTALATFAQHYSLKPPWHGETTEIRPGQPSPPHRASPFLTAAIALHNEKHAAYGDSWKRRGEMLGIMANIARKIDRFGGSETSDETSADTALDTMVYLAKYRTWLKDQRVFQGESAPTPGTSSDTPDAANELLVETEKEMAGWFPEAHQTYVPESFESDLRFNFDQLEKKVLSADPERWRLVDQMLRDAYLLARIRWEAAQDEYRGADHE